MFDSTRKVRAIAATTGIPFSCGRSSSAWGQRLCRGVWQAGDVIWQQAVVFLFYHRVALACALLQPCAIQYLDMAATVLDQSVRLQLAGGLGHALAAHEH